MDGMGWNYSDKVKEHFLRPHNVLDVNEEEYNKLPSDLQK